MQHTPDKRRVIWVVDDSRTDAERLRQLLANDNDIEIILDAAVAIERLGAGTAPDLLLLDWVMPQISGLEVCQYVRAAGGKISEVPIILITAQRGSDEIVQAFKSGANDYISKPFVPEELQARVRSLLGMKRSVERAEQAEADVRTLLTNAPDPIFAVDAQGRVTFANEEALRVLDKALDDVIAKSFHELIPGISTKHISVATGESFFPLPDVHIGARAFSPSIRILPSDNSATTTVSLRDVTSRRKAEARRLDFYSIIAHDLRTPVTSALLRIQIALRGKHGILAAGLITDLRRMEASLRSLVGMINDFLELAKLEGVGYKIDRQPVDIPELIQNTIEDFRPLLEKHDLNWKHFGFEKVAIALGDRQRLVQVFSNLIGNAIKFTPADGSITTSVIVTDEHIEASVEDTGCGVPKDQLASLFERFTQATNQNSDGSGTGLGLMIVREIIEAHGGLIGAESEVGIGSRFWFRLPRYQAAAFDEEKLQC